MLEDLKRAANGSILETTAGYRTAIGVMGVLLSPVLVTYGLYRQVPIQGSISAYYHQTMTRDWFVGTLFVIGTFLFFYKYTPGRTPAKSNITAVKTGHLDAWLGKAAGITAVTVALWPTHYPEGTKTFSGYVHYAAAVILFGCLALFPLMLFSNSQTRPRFYKSIGWSMIGVLGIALAWYLFDAKTQPLLAIETALITLFGWSWFAKGRDQATAA